MVQSMGQKCIDIESATNESLQSEDKKLASPIQMEVDGVQSPDETENSNNIECCERSNISFLDFLFEFCLTFCLHSFWSAFYVKTLKLVHFCNTDYIFYFKISSQMSRA